MNANAIILRDSLFKTINIEPRVVSKNPESMTA